MTLEQSRGQRLNSRPLHKRREQMMDCSAERLIHTIPMVLQCRLIHLISSGQGWVENHRLTDYDQKTRKQHDVRDNDDLESDLRLMRGNRITQMEKLTPLLAVLSDRSTTGQYELWMILETTLQVTADSFSDTMPNAIRGHVKENMI
jgi:hypothetical protein